MSADIWIWLSPSVSSLASVFTRCNNLNGEEISLVGRRRANMKRDEIVVMTRLYEASFDMLFKEKQVRLYYNLRNMKNTIKK